MPRTLKLYEPHIVIHLAGIVGDSACAKKPELATKTNVEGVKHLVDKVNKTGVNKLIFASTCSVYGNNSKVCEETSELNPLSHYAHTKIEAEKYIQENSKQGIIFRFGTMYGLSPNMRYDLGVNRLVYDAIKSHEFNIFGGLQYRPFLHPRDLAQFLLFIMDKDLSKFYGGIFNLVSENITIKELGELVERTIPYSTMNLIEDKEDGRSYICRGFKAYSYLGFTPHIRIRDGIQEVEKELIRLKKYNKLKELNMNGQCIWIQYSSFRCKVGKEVINFDGREFIALPSGKKIKITIKVEEYK